MARGICAIGASLAAALVLAACGGSGSDQAMGGCGATPSTPRTTFTYELGPGISSDVASETSDVICKRLSALDVSGAVSTKDDQLTLVMDEEGSERYSSVIGDQSGLYFYELEPNVVPRPDSGLRLGDVTPSTLANQAQGEYQAVELASTQRSQSCQGELCASRGPGFYLFEKQSLQYVAGPEASEADLFALKAAQDVPEEKRQILEVPEGTIVVKDQPQTDQEGNPIEGALAKYFVLKDDPSLTGTDISDPEANFDPTTNQPNVVFSFTADGRIAFEQISRDIAQRGLENADGSGASYSFAIVVDGQIVSRPVIDYNENPDGIDGRNGAQISGTFTVEETQQLADFLGAGTLPTFLELVGVESEE